MERVELVTTNREVRGKSVKQLRAAEWVPAVMYGPDTPPLVIQAEERAISKAIMAAGSTALIDLSIEGESNPRVVLAREIQRHALNGRLVHVDFYEVRLTEKVKTSPRLVFVGVSPIVHSGEAVLIHSMNEVEVECLPTDLINSIEVDISSLERMDDSVTVSQLPVPPGITILADPSDVVVSVVPSRAALDELAEEAEEAEVAWLGEEAVEEEE